MIAHGDLDQDGEIAARRHRHADRGDADAEDVLERARELGILITPLPAYSPDFMPVEALWRWMREEVTYNHCHATAAALIAGVDAFQVKANEQSDVVFRRLYVRTGLDLDQEKLRIS